MSEPLTFGGYQGPASVHSQAVHIFAKSLSRLTEGQTELDFHQDITDTGRNAADLFDLVEGGDLKGCYFSSSYLCDRVPELALLDQHFAVLDRAQAYHLLDGPFGQRLTKAVAARTGYVVLGFWDNGLRHISTASTSLLDTASCAGKTLRTLPSEDHQRVFKALGFSPVVVDVCDLVKAVETGRVDAQENPLTNTYNFGLHKTHRTVTLTGHLLGVALVLFNAKEVERWSPEVRRAIVAALDEATAAQRKLAQDAETACARAMKAEGVRFVTLTAGQRAEFAKCVKPAINVQNAKLSLELIELFKSELVKSNQGAPYEQ